MTIWLVTMELLFIIVQIPKYVFEQLCIQCLFNSTYNINNNNVKNFKEDHTQLINYLYSTIRSYKCLKYT